MTAKLVAVSGPLRGSAFAVEGDEYTIGRDPASSLCLDDPAVSRHHCVLQSDAGSLRICDLGSRNGTIINQRRITEQELAGGETIQIGQSVFIIAVEDQRASLSPESSILRTGTIILRPQESVYLQAGAAERAGRVERELAALLRLSAEAANVSDAAALERTLQRLIPQLLPCESVAVRFLDTAAPADAPEQRAISEGAAVLHNARTLAVPLKAASEAAAVLRVEAASEGFDDHHLQLAGAVSAIVSPALDRIRRIDYLEAENRRLRVEVETQFDMVAESPRMREVLQVVSRAARSDATLLILGESGTGKELVARAVHKASPRAERSFVAVNCAALNENLLESELFGHEKGAFTGAVAQKRGRIELAEGGTLFLDEIGELAASLQAKLLRVLQEREFERVGGLRALRANVRVVAATNRDLDEAVRRGTFRQDLFYRLNVIAVRMPPLRDRREDIAPLATFFAARSAARSGRSAPPLSAAVRACLLRYEWPGNVRELENAIERAVVLGSADAIQLEDLPEAVVEAGGGASAESGYHEAVAGAKRRIIVGALEQTGGNQTAAARLLGLNPTYLSRLMKNLDLGRYS